MLVAGFLCLFTSMGEYARLFNKTVSFDNIISPFYYLSKLTDIVKHFRIMARFSWPFFWIMNILIIFALDRFLTSRKQKFYPKIVGISLIFLLTTDFVSHLGFYSDQQATNPFGDRSRINGIAAIFENVNIEEYQAILPAPYYHAGSPDLAHTIDPVDAWCTDTYLMQLYSGLPLMSSKMSRTVVNHAISLTSVSRGDQIDPALMDRLNTSPVLIPYNKNPEMWPDRADNMRKAMQDSFIKFTQVQTIEKIAENDDLVLYKWLPSSNNYKDK
jgi:hypothetical protein